MFSSVTAELEETKERVGRAVLPYHQYVEESLEPALRSDVYYQHPEMWKKNVLKTEPYRARTRYNIKQILGGAHNK